MQIKRGDIYYADLTPVVGSEQGGIRPVLIVQNDVGNQYSPTLIAAAITSRNGKKPLPTHIRMEDRPCGLTKESTVLLEQIRTIDRTRLKEYIGHVGGKTMRDVDRAIAVSFGLDGTLFLERVPMEMERDGDDYAGQEREQEGTVYGNQKAGMGLLFN